MTANDVPAMTPNDPLTEEALGWLVHLHSGAETDEDFEAYEAWKSADPSHAEAGARAEHVWDRLGPALKPRRTARSVAGALVVAAGLGAAGFASGALYPAWGWLADQTTATGEIRTVELTDGSSITMDSETSFDIAYSTAERRIRFIGGQIHVEVAADASRPFVVEAGSGTVRALGTAFNLRMDDDRTEVSVSQHSVRVTYDKRASIDIGEGQAVTYGRATGLESLRPVDIVKAGAWQRGEIEFDDRSLGAVADEMRRYRRGTVVFTDERLRELPVTGLFSTRDTDAFFTALEKTLPVKVAQLPYLTVIRRDHERPLAPYRRAD